MNLHSSVFNNLIVCGLIQVTLVALVATMASFWIQWRKRSSIPLLTAALTSIVLLTFAVMIPLPSWLQQHSSRSQSFSLAPDDTKAPGDEADNPPTRIKNSTATTNAFGFREFVAAGVDGIRNLNQPPDTNANPKPDYALKTTTVIPWANCFLTLFGVGIAFGLVRLIGGIVGVSLLVRSSRPISNSRLHEAIDLLAAQLRCFKAVSIRESNRLSSAATVGWRHPVILLSPAWREWSDDQLRSVLAHELSHIARGDFLTTVLAQIGLVLHFYHPLVHWLVSRIRLEQELAADAMAAQVVGDPRIYLRAIGEIALSQSSEQLSWPAHTFLPTRKTFLRRVEMLRDLRLFSGSVSIALRVGSVCVMALVALVAVGIRPTAAVAENPVGSPVATQRPRSGSTAISDPVEAHFVPADASAVALVRISELLPLLESVNQTTGSESKDDYFTNLFQSLRSCTQMTAIVGPVNNAGIDPFACVLEFTDKASRDAAIGKLAPTKVLSKETYLTFQYERFGNNAKYFPDDKTVVVGELETVKRMMLAGRQSASILTRSKNWQDATRASIAANLDVTAFRETMAKIPSDPILGLFSPLWKQAKSHLLSISLKNRAGISLTTIPEDPSSAETIATSLNSGVGLLKSFVQSNAKVPPLANNIVDVMKLLESKSISKSDGAVTMSLSMDAEALSKMVTSVVVPALAAGRVAAQRAEMTNNLKHAMMALHTYHDAYGHFPPAVVIDEKSGVARSWRVEILPFIDQGQLYEQYKKDQPWDSPANKPVLDKMPNIFRHPRLPVGSINSAIFAAYGKGLFFEPDDKVGKKLTDITDGTSSTIAILEGNKDVPWTKPEEILIDVQKDQFPPFGNTNNDILLVGFGDGAVHVLAKSIDLKVLKALFTRAGGEVGP